MTIPNMHHETELTREKTHDEHHHAVVPGVASEAQSTQSDTDSEGRRSSSQDDVVLVNFQPGEPADPHNWSSVSTASHHCRHLVTQSDDGNM